MAIMLTPPDASIGVGSRNELDSLGADDPGPVVILPTPLALQAWAQDTQRKFDALAHLADSLGVDIQRITDLHAKLQQEIRDIVEANHHGDSA